MHNVTLTFEEHRSVDNILLILEKIPISVLLEKGKVLLRDEITSRTEMF